MQIEGGIVASAAALIVLGMFPSLIALRFNRDVFDPRIMFPVVYSAMTAGPTLWWMISGWYYKGVVVANVVHVLLSCASGIAAYHVAVWCVLGDVRIVHGVISVDAKHRLVGWIVRLSLLVAIIGYLVFSIYMHSNVGNAHKSEMLAALPDAWRNIYTKLSGVIMLLFVLVMSIESGRYRMCLTSTTAALIAMYGIISIWNGERDLAFIAIGWLILNTRHIGRRIAYGVLVVIIAVVSIIPLVRGSGLEAGKQAEAVKSVKPEFMLATLMTNTSSNFYVFTNVVEWVPYWEPYLHGRSYLYAVMSFVTNDERVVHAEMNNWYKDRYAPESSVGYGFAMDAEAYVNYGWIGVPVVFFLWGMVIAIVYKHHIVKGGAFSAYVWAITFIASMYGIRMYSRVILKMIVYGVLFAVLFYLIAELLVLAGKYEMHRHGASGTQG